MKATSTITSQLMEGVCQLPGVAVLDWCDRAAAALSRMHTPSGAMVAVGQLDRRGTVNAIENVGAAWCCRVDEGPGSAGVPAAPVSLQGIRESITPGDWIGWDLRATTPGEVSVFTQRPTPAISRRAATGLNKRWDALANCELLIGHVPVGGTAPDRVLVAEVALVNSTPEDMARYQTVFAVILPLIAARYLNALGPEPADKHSWLTPREEMILWKLVSGKKVPQIATELHRSIYTVHDHVKSLHRKLGASNRGQLVARALGHLGPLFDRANSDGPVEEDSEERAAPPAGPTPVIPPRNPEVSTRHNGNGHHPRQAQPRM
jgi:DNA-binding CsgD family transcriptional regulator